ncbi:hypothetical protein [Pseudomonas chlororaphis]|uniref:hypothetical protein n=1 Tax=Pseudomonas chlororaphis TaxID=587753 RepID=UPI0012D2E9C3|nr:hypothetical protein [Pseudomonas chlororaphis]
MDRSKRFIAACIPSVHLEYLEGCYGGTAGSRVVVGLKFFLRLPPWVEGGGRSKSPDLPGGRVVPGLQPILGKASKVEGWWKMVEGDSFQRLPVACRLLMPCNYLYSLIYSYSFQIFQML